MTFNSVLESIGCEPQTFVSRDMMLISMEFLQSELKTALRQLYLSICKPKFTHKTIEPAVVRVHFVIL